MSGSWIGPLFIAVSALMWATDALFRVPAVSAIDPTIIVAVEHLIGIVLLSPIIFLGSRTRKQLTKLNAKGWLGAIFIGVAGSAIATILFTASFRYLNPSVTILLQKLQPVLVVAFAAVFLGEKPGPRFLGWAAVALASAIVLSFPDLDFRFLRSGLNLRSRGVIYAVSAAGIWAITTVVGKALLRKIPVLVTTYWRYLFGLATLVALFAIGGISIPLGALQQTHVLTALLYMGLIPGLAAMVFYYQGLSRTPASVTTFVELIFPVSAVILNSIVLKMPLSPVQIGAGAVLLLSVSQVSRK